MCVSIDICSINKQGAKGLFRLSICRISKMFIKFTAIK